MIESGPLQTLVSAIYPPRCLACGDMVKADFGLCGPCRRDAHFIGDTSCDCCGVPLPGTRHPGEVLTCDDCMETARPWARGRAALVYSGTGRRVVLALKHGDRLDIADTAAGWMYQAGRDLFQDDRTLIAPVPLHWLRLLKRRYNQAALLAQSLAHQSGCAACPDLLKRAKRTRPLEGKSKDARFATLDTAFSVHPKRQHRLVGRHVLLIDDVMTSGATLSAAAKTCLAAGAHHVSVLCLARAMKDA